MVLQLLERLQSAEESATQAPCFAEQVPSKLQRSDFLQSWSETAAHLPSSTPHLPSLAHVSAFLQPSAMATHWPSRATHWAPFVHAALCAHSSSEAAVHRPASALQCPK